MKLTRNFQRSEFTFSEAAARHGINNEVPLEHVQNLIRLSRWLQKLRDRLCEALGRDVEVSILSGYRCKELNKVVGGSKNSRHMLALAGDIVAEGLTPDELAKFIYKNMQDMPLDELIVEFDRWVHVAVAEFESAPKRRYSRAVKRKNALGKMKTEYELLVF